MCEIFCVLMGSRQSISLPAMEYVTPSQMVATSGGTFVKARMPKTGMVRRAQTEHKIPRYPT